MRKLAVLVLFVLLGVAPAQAFSQCENVANSCSSELMGFLSDGQFYGARIGEGETAILKITLFAGYTYRIVACTEDESMSQIEYTIKDGRGVRIFKNSHLPDGKGWDFKVGATDLYTMEAVLTSGEGCVVFEIGYKEDDDWEAMDPYADSDGEYSDDDLEGWENIDEDFNLDDLDDFDLEN